MMRTSLQLIKKFKLNVKPFTEIFIVQRLTPPNEKFDHNFFEDSTVKKLNQREHGSAEGLLTKTEWLKALKEMDTNKTPGSDGLPAEF